MHEGTNTSASAEAEEFLAIMRELTSVNRARARGFLRALAGGLLTAEEVWGLLPDVEAVLALADQRLDYDEVSPVGDYRADAESEEERTAPTLEERRQLLTLIAADPSALTDLSCDLGVDAVHLALQAIACELVAVSIQQQEDHEVLAGTGQMIGGLLAGLWGTDLREDRDPDAVMTKVGDRNREIGLSVREATSRALQHLPAVNS